MHDAMTDLIDSPQRNFAAYNERGRKRRQRSPDRTQYDDRPDKPDVPGTNGKLFIDSYRQQVAKQDKASEDCRSYD